jgi:predicted MPP superfamily phosphohydrolase
MPRTLAFLVFFATVVALDFGSHLYLVRRLITPLGLPPGWHRLAAALIWANAIALPLTFSLLPRSGGRLADLAQYGGYLLMGLWSVLLALTLFRDGGLLVLGVADRVGVPGFDPQRRDLLLRGSAAVLLGASGLLTGAAWRRARRLAEVVRIELPIAGLHPALDGFRIAQISDLHVGPTIRAPMIEAVVARVNELQPDLVALTGDLVDGPVDRLAPHVEPLRGLSSRHGTWFVTGNHEYYSGVHKWLAKCRELGMTTLVDEHGVIEHDGATMLVAGVTDITAPRMEPEHVSSPRKACEGAPPTDFKLLLAHQPESCREGEGCGFHLQLSGHTHGGQYWPYSALIKLAKRWVRGLYRVGAMWVYVNPGTTYWGPPLRLGSPQEITLLTLRRA